MESKINFEVENARMKVGTMDKKKPTAIYVEFNGYITPQNEKENYKDDAANMEKELKKLVSNTLKDENKYLKSDLIFALDLADDRINYNKSSFYTLQFFVKPQELLLKETNLDFKQLGEIIGNIYISYFEYIKEIFYKYGFLMSKNKN